MLVSQIERIGPYHSAINGYSYYVNRRAML